MSYQVTARTSWPVRPRSSPRRLPGRSFRRCGATDGRGVEVPSRGRGPPRLSPAQGRWLAGPRWEVYGPHRDDPAELTTEVCWLLS